MNWISFLILNFKVFLIINNLKFYNVQNFKCLRRDSSQNVKEDSLIDKGYLSVTFQKWGEQSFCLGPDWRSWERDGDRSQTSKRNNTQAERRNL